MVHLLSDSETDRCIIHPPLSVRGPGPSASATAQRLRDDAPQGVVLTVVAEEGAHAHDLQVGVEDLLVLEQPVVGYLGDLVRDLVDRLLQLVGGHGQADQPLREADLSLPQLVDDVFCGLTSRGYPCLPSSLQRLSKSKQSGGWVSIWLERNRQRLRASGARTPEVYPSFSCALVRLRDASMSRPPPLRPTRPRALS